MIKIEHSSTIHRSIEEVFAYMTDLRNAPEWQSGLLEMRQTTEGPVSTGAKYVGVRRFLGRKLESSIEIVEYEPNTKLSWKTISSPTPFVSSWLFETTAEGTKVIWNLEVEVGFFGLADPLVAAAIRRDAEAGFGTLKDLLENEVVSTAR